MNYGREGNFAFTGGISQILSGARRQKTSTITGVLPAQKEFANSIDTPFSAIVGGFGSGKTRSIIARYCNLSVKRSGKVRLLVVAPSYSLLEDIDEPLFLGWLDKNNIPYTHQKSRHIITIHDYYQGEIWFRSGDNPDRLVGFECTDFVIDEFDILKFDHQKSLWEKVIARARLGDSPTGGIVTTPEGYRYTHKLFVEDEIGPMFKAKTTDNFYLPETYISNLYSQYDAKLVEQYVNGEFISLVGRHAYYGYSENNLFYYKKDTGFDEDVVYVAMDFNVDPMTAVSCYYKSGMLYAFDEIFLNNSNTDEMCEEIEKRYPGKRIIVAPDLTGKGRHSSASKGITNIIKLRMRGYGILGNEDVGNPFIRDRINCLNASLNMGLLFMNRSLNYLLKDLKQLRTDERGEIIKENPMMEHISTALGYLVWWLQSPTIYKTSIKIKQG